MPKKVESEKLDELIAESGVSKRTADKLRRANGEQPVTRGHGAAHEDTSSLGEL